ncbi:MAG: SIMPL domain-containing protein [Armatimonadetes bacterium]|nr:SIMPL domain-containing protein [Armatimonadota bacterium]
MTNKIIVSLIVLLAGSGLCHGQVGGNIGYSAVVAKAKAEQRERAKRVLTQEELPPTGTSTFVEANVLMNVKADEWVAVFGITQEGETLAECGEKMDATVKTFSAELKKLGIGDGQLFLDFVSQTKIYGFEQQDNTLQEKLVGFVLNKNLSIHYTDQALLDKLTLAAARSQVFDLIKVDYIVEDINAVQDVLMQEAARIIKQKVARYEKLLGIKLEPPAQVYAERPAIHYPTQMYDSYTAYESEQILSQAQRQRYTVLSARKTRTFFFNALDGDGFDAVINPVIIEPVVQFTLYLKLKYEVEQSKAKQTDS